MVVFTDSVTVRENNLYALVELCVWLQEDFMFSLDGLYASLMALQGSEVSRW